MGRRALDEATVMYNYDCIAWDSQQFRNHAERFPLTPAKVEACLRTHHITIERQPLLGGAGVSILGFRTYRIVINTTPIDPVINLFAHELTHIVYRANSEGSFANYDELEDAITKTGDEFVRKYPEYAQSVYQRLAQQQPY
jgi:hypothetical protein